MTGTTDGEFVDHSGHFMSEQDLENYKQRYNDALYATRSESYFKGDVDPQQSMLFASMFATSGLNRRLDPLDGAILQFYHIVVARQAVILDGQSCNPCRYLLMPMASASSTILLAILVISATKLAHVNDKYQARALAHRQRLYSHLGKRLQTIRSDIASFREALVSVFILCWADITDHCRPTWLNHMMGISSVLDAAPMEALDDPLTTKLVAFCRQYLLYHLVMARATFCVDKLIPGWKPALAPLLENFKGPSSPPTPILMPSRITGNLMDWTPSLPLDPPQNLQRIPMPIETEDPDEIDIHQGFSNSLLIGVNDICDLAQNSRFDGMDDAFENMNRLHELLQKVNELCRRIENIVQKPPKALQRGAKPNDWGLLDPSIGDDEWRRLRQQEQLLGVVTATAEANRLGCLLFLDDICAQRFPGIIPSCRSDRKRNIHRILDLTDRVCAYGSVTAALPIWPVFIVACAVDDEQDRIRVLSIMENFRRNQSFGVRKLLIATTEEDADPFSFIQTIPPTHAVIESVWRQRDLACDDKGSLQRTRLREMTSPLSGPCGQDFKGFGTDERYPWERAMLTLKGPVLSLT